MSRFRRQPQLPLAALAGLLALCLLSVYPGTTLHAQQATTYPMTVTQNRVPGATGQVTITPVGSNQLMVAINITGLPSTPSSRAAHIHAGPGAVCDNNAPVVYPLNNVAVDSSGNGTSTTTITLTPDQPIMANDAYVNVHEQASPPGNGVICANITQSYTASGTSSGATTPAAPGTAVGTGTLTFTTPATSGTTTSMPGMTMPATATGTTTSATTPSASSSSGQPAGPGGCAPGDSWCNYCSMHSGSSVCTQYPPTASVDGLTALATTPAPAAQTAHEAPELSAAPAAMTALAR